MIWREDALGNGISDTGGDAETHTPIIGDQSMEEHVVKVEVMMDRGCKILKMCSEERILTFPQW